MRVVALAVGIAFVIVGALGSGIVVALYMQDAGGWLYVTPAAMAVLSLAPLLVGAYLSFWDTRRPDGTRPLYRRLVGVVVAAQVLGAALIITAVVMTGAPWWLPLPFVLFGALFGVAALFGGPALRQRESRVTPEAPAVWSAYSRQEARRDVRSIVVVGASVMLAAAAIFVALRIVIGGRVPGFGTLMAPALGLIGAGFATDVILFRLSRRLRDLAQGDPTRVRRIVKAILRPEKFALSAGDQPMAARYAAVAWIYQLYSAIAQATTFIALGLIQGSLLLGGADNPVIVALLVFCVAAPFVIVPLLSRQAARMRRYARQHPVADAVGTPVSGGSE